MVAIKTNKIGCNKMSYRAERIEAYEKEIKELNAKKNSLESQLSDLKIANQRMENTRADEQRMFAEKTTNLQEIIEKMKGEFNTKQSQATQIKDNLTRQTKENEKMCSKLKQFDTTKVLIRGIYIQFFHYKHQFHFVNNHILMYFDQWIDDAQKIIRAIHLKLFLFTSVKHFRL
ncbi:hypothetical protein RFI_15128 [Reticulomyxa filosa]|uniref:Uncharacterized protein n=1 Tax=Reticulomyxa filosa TaxID=46433 RepID=X6N7Q3_RETFI|nr:hypothetical protein RFI_15128 [Reticulomyxa filosa]|eukprot:ETO22076.1 hypothetical protein RFI_15128 [Reticulomyxa filosa]